MKLKIIPLLLLVSFSGMLTLSACGNCCEEKKYFCEHCKDNGIENCSGYCEKKAGDEKILDADDMSEQHELNILNVLNNEEYHQYKDKIIRSLNLTKDLLSLYQLESSNENFLFSPLSYDILLHEVLNFSSKAAEIYENEYKDKDILAKDLNVIQKQLQVFDYNSSLENNNSFVRYANFLLLNENYKNSVNQDLRKEMCFDYNLLFKPVDFNRTEEVKNFVNKYVAEKTSSLINPLLNESYPKSTNLVLMQILCHKAQWNFDMIKDLEHTEFTMINGEKQKVDFIQTSKNTTFSYGENANFVYASLPYVNGDELVIILPKEDKWQDVSSVLSQYLDLLSYSYRNNTSLPMEQIKLRLSMPKFTIESDLDLLKLLKNTKYAEYYKYPLDKLYFSDNDEGKSVIQKTKFIVDEKGSKAVAVSTMVKNMSALPSENQEIILTLNRPFAFVLKNGDEILFVSTVRKIN